MKQVNISIPNLNNPAVDFPPVQTKEIEAAMLNVKRAMALNIRQWANATQMNAHMFEKGELVPCLLKELMDQLQALTMMSASVQTKTF